MLYDDTDYKLTWAAMEKLVEKGLVRSIGLSNFNSRQIDDVLSVASIKPTVLQVQDFCGDDDEGEGCKMAEVTVVSVCTCLAGRESPLLGSGRAAGPLSGSRFGDDGVQSSGVS